MNILELTIGEEREALLKKMTDDFIVEAIEYYRDQESCGRIGAGCFMDDYTEDTKKIIYQRALKIVG